MKIKGHTEIQVRDAKTGRIVQHTHDDNMVTNGLAGFLKNHGVLNDTALVANIRADFINNLLGGIMLFNDTLAASADTVIMPDGVKMTANGSYGTTHTGDPTELGSYDANESGWQDAAHTTYRLVYNWTESQGNGVIKAAALTSKVHGLVGEGNSTSGKAIATPVSVATDCGEKALGVLSDPIVAVKNNTIYALSVDQNAQEFTISTTHISDTELGVNDPDSIANSIWEEVATHANPSSVITLSNDVYRGVQLLFLQSKTVLMLRGNEGIVVIEMSTNMQTITDYYDVTSAATSLAWLYNGTAFLTSTGEYIVCAESENGNTYKVEVANPVNVTQITKDAAAKVDYPYFSAGKRHYMRNSVYDETLGTIVVNNARTDTGSTAKAADVYKTDKSLVFLASTYYNNLSAFRNNAYIATVNNLQNSVTKDSTQTMKVIYTLTFS